MLCVIETPLLGTNRGTKGQVTPSIWRGELCCRRLGDCHAIEDEMRWLTERKRKAAMLGQKHSTAELHHPWADLCACTLDSVNRP
jgi:hypothetical protein